MEKDLSFLNNIRIAHRGLCIKDLCENSMDAFKECVKRDIAIELDVRILKDNSLIVIHDGDTGRVCDKKMVLKDCVYEDIKDLKLNDASSGISLLKDVLDFVNGKVLLDIELKCDDMDVRICKEICKLLDNYHGQFIIKSFNSFCMLWIRKNRPNYIRGLLISSNGKMNRLFYNLVKPDFIVFNYKKLPNKIVDNIYNSGIPLLLYTLRDNEVLEYKYTGIIYEG